VTPTWLLEIVGSTSSRMRSRDVQTTQNEALRALMRIGRSATADESVPRSAGVRATLKHQTR